HAELLERYDIRHGVTFKIEKACLPGVRSMRGVPASAARWRAPGKPALLRNRVTGNPRGLYRFWRLVGQQTMTDSPIGRPVVIVSYSTGLSAETVSHAVLSQFDELAFQSVRLPFIDSVEKADAAARRITLQADRGGPPPLVFSTLVDSEIADRIRTAPCVFLDLFGSFVHHLEGVLGVKASRSVGRSHTNGLSKQYNNRIEAINFSLAHDDGQYVQGLEQADVILVGVS